MIRDQIIFGANENKLQEKLLRETDLTLDSAIKICQASELARQQIVTFREPAHGAVHQENEAVNAMLVKGKPQSKFTSSDTRNKNNDKEMFTCKRCGKKKTHRPRQCPADRKTCAKCKGQNHFARMCRSKKYTQ